MQAQVINLMQDLQEELGLSYLFVAHDLSIVRHISNRIAVMYLGQIVEIGDAATIYERPLHPYSRALLAAAPRPDPNVRRMRAKLAGDPPSPMNKPSGCPFRTRCPIARPCVRRGTPAARAARRAARRLPLLGVSALVAPLTPELTAELVRRALANIAREYPNHPQYLLDSDDGLAPPRIVHPVFFGCFDWHSAVHTHWLLVRLLRDLDTGPQRSAIESSLDAAFTADKLLVEARYLEGHPSFERPYGLAWLTLLIAETAPTRWREPLAPLAAAARANVLRWLGALRYAVRSGTHNQTAFALSLLFDAAAVLEDAELEGAVRRKALELYLDDLAAPLAYEPSGEDFLSPALMEADLMQRLIPQREFIGWLQRFLPGHPADGRRSVATVRRSRRRDRRQMGASARPESVAGVEPAQYRGRLAARRLAPRGADGRRRAAHAGRPRSDARGPRLRRRPLAAVVRGLSTDERRFGTTRDLDGA